MMTDIDKAYEIHKAIKGLSEETGVRKHWCATRRNYWIKSLQGFACGTPEDRADNVAYHYVKILG